MYIYYLLIVISVFMFGGSFAMQDVYRRMRGADGVKLTFEMIFIGSLGGLIALILINCFSFDSGIHFDVSGLNPGFTWFTLLIAVLSVINGFLFTYCSFKVLGIVNLSMFSLFAMLGGMVIPFFQGIVFYKEPITLAKIIAVIFITLALICTIDFNKKSSSKTDKKAYIYYFGVFMLNGLGGALSKIYSSAPQQIRISDAGYSIWLSLLNTIIAGIVLLVAFPKKRAEQNGVGFTDTAICATSGVLNKVANFMLIVALTSGIDASVQYPMVTGGVMIVSTLAAYLTDKKPTKKEVLSIAIAFIGTLMLFVIPI